MKAKLISQLRWLVCCIPLSLSPLTVCAWPFSSESNLIDLTPVPVNNYFAGESDIFSLSGSGPTPTLGTFTAAQIAGSGWVKVNYPLTLANAASANVALTFSTNGGASFTVVPAGGTLTGDYGSGVTPGYKTVYWNAGAMLPAQMFNANMVAKVTATATGVYSVNTSPRFTLDLQGVAGGLTVQGRVLSQATKSPINGATVSVGGQNVLTGGDGKFSLTGVSLFVGGTLTITKSGFSTHSETLTPPPGTRTHTLPDVCLPPPGVGGKPVVTGIKPKMDGVFFGTLPITNEFTASVNWNGSTPNSVEFYVNDALIKTVPATAAEVTAAIPMNSGFSPVLGVPNRFQAVAVGSGQRSDKFVRPVTVIPSPSWLSRAQYDWPLLVKYVEVDPVLSIDVRFPDEGWPMGKTADLPFLGKFGWQTAVDLEFDLALLTGEWELRAGVGPSGHFEKNRRGERPHSTLTKPKFFLGNRSIDFGVKLQADGTISQATPFLVEHAGIVLVVNAEMEILAIYPMDYVPIGQALHVLDVLKVIGIDLNSLQRVQVWGTLDAELSLMAKLQPPPMSFDPAALKIGAGIKAVYEPDLVLAKGKIYIGGKVVGEFQIWPFEFQKLSGQIYGGVEFRVWRKTVVDEEFLILEGVIWQNSAAASPMLARAMTTTVAPDVSQRIYLKVKSHEPKAFDRSYLKRGPERFVANRPDPEVKLPNGRKVSRLEAFRLVGKDHAKKNTPRKNGQTLDDPPIAQADVPIIENVATDSEPALASRGQELMLLYVTDNGNPNNLQFTDIKWTYYDGTNWTSPLAIQTDTRAEFTPRVVFDGNGDAIAAWERVATTNLTDTNLTAMAQQMEIVWSRWNRTNGTWSVPAALTTNGYLDHAPLLCGPVTSGDVLLTWTMNTSNLLMGTGAVGAPENSTVMATGWNSATKTWGTPQTLVANLPYRITQSLAGATNRAVYAWTRDMDGIVTNTTGQQVFYCGWTNGVWGGPVQFTAATNESKNVRAAVAQTGDTYLLWQNASNLVMNVNFAASNRLVRADAQSSGFADCAVTIGPNGNLALVWQDMSDTGSDAHYLVYDPASATWSKDAQLFADAGLERSFAPVWDSLGNVVMAYNKVEIITTNLTLQVEGGGTVVVTNVPQSGQIDLDVMSRAVVKDIALLAADFTADGENFLPGDAVTLSARVRNTGNVGVTNVAVAFYDGNYTNGGTLITNVVLTGWIEGASTDRVATATWVVPDPGTNHTLYAVLDPTGLVTEFNETNNVQSVNIGGVDLSVTMISTTAETNGAVRVIAQVQNIGAPGATNSTMAIRRYGQTNGVLAVADVPALLPGRLAQVALDLPAGTQPEGEARYTLFADETRGTGDTVTNNNTATFAVIMVPDSDGDGIPDSWENAHGLNPLNPNDALLDNDHDGLNNLAEYLAGTDPNDPNSYLKINSIAAATGGGWAQLTWGSVSNRLYSVQRSTDLLNFSPIAEHILATPPVNSYLDTTATNAPEAFYRIRLE